MSLTDTDIRIAANDLFGTKESFTAFDVTLKLQELGHSIRHRDAREDLHRTLNQMLVEPPYSGFSISHIRKAGKSIMVYHEHQADPYDVQLSQDPNPKPVQVSVCPSHKNSTKKTKDMLYDYRGRYTISSRIMKDFLDTVYVEAGKRTDDTGYIEITDDPQSGGTPFTRCEKVFRISPSWFKKAFGHLPANVDMTHLPQVAGGYSSILIVEK